MNIAKEIEALEKALSRPVTMLMHLSQRDLSLALLDERRRAVEKLAALRQRVEGDGAQLARSDAWLAVAALLSELRPGWDDGDMTGMECALAAIREMAAPAAPSVPDGWVMVPREPTDQMLVDAGTMNNYDVDAGGRTDDDHIAWWCAMLAAAPAAPQRVDALRDAQAQAVMPLIGPLLDAWEQAYTDDKELLQEAGIAEHIEAIADMMENHPDPQCAAPAAPAAADIENLTRRIDVALNGDGAAIQASLCDIVSQCEAEVRKRGGPILITGTAPAAVVDEATQRENEILRTALVDLLSWFPEKPSPSEWRIEAGERGADDAIQAARDALFGKQGGGYGT